MMKHFSMVAQFFRHKPQTALCEIFLPFPRKKSMEDKRVPNFKISKLIRLIVGKNQTKISNSYRSLTTKILSANIFIKFTYNSYYHIMANQQLNQELYTLGKSLLKAWLILYKIYKPFIKAFLIAFIAYIAFKIGRKTIADPFQERVNKLQAKLKNRARYILELPEKIKNIAKLKIILIIIFVLTLVAVPLMLHFKVKFIRKISKSILVQIGIVQLLSVLAAWIYQWWLQKIQKEGRSANISINQQLYATTKEMGAKAEGLLRTFLCKEKQLQKPRKPTGVCWKEKCKEERKLAKDRSDLFENLVQSALGFEWCSICKTKLPFQEFLQFQSYRFQKQEGAHQSEEVDRKNDYLITELSRMSAWVRGISPCNCSRLYWMQQIKHIKNFKLGQKELELRQQLVRRKSYIVRK